MKYVYNLDRRWDSTVPDRLTFEKFSYIGPYMATKYTRLTVEGVYTKTEWMDIGSKIGREDGTK